MEVISGYEEYINRIKVEFKDEAEIEICFEITILIESKWNLKDSCLQTS